MISWLSCRMRLVLRLCMRLLVRKPCPLEKIQRAFERGHITRAEMLELVHDQFQMTA